MVLKLVQSEGLEGNGNWTIEYVSPEHLIQKTSLLKKGSSRDNKQSLLIFIPTQ